MEKTMIPNPDNVNEFMEWDPGTLEVIRPQIILCPECSEGQIIMEGRCKYCPICGWSACSV